MAHIPISWKDFLLPPPQLSLSHTSTYTIPNQPFIIFFGKLFPHRHLTRNQQSVFYREKNSCTQKSIRVFLLLIPPVFYDDEDDDFTFSCALCVFETKKCAAFYFFCSFLLDNNNHIFCSFFGSFPFFFEDTHKTYWLHFKCTFWKNTFLFYISAFSQQQYYFI